jgi:outer membrane immunogenic protein
MYRVSNLIRAIAVLGATLVGTTSVMADGFDRRRGGYGHAPHSWSGIYLGVNGGAAWGDVDWAYAPPDPGLTRNISGGLFGMHAGIQHQWNQIVLGIEASYSGSLGGDIDGRGPDSLFPSEDAYARANSVFTIGPKIGWAMTRDWLLYGTGGYASARLNTKFIERATGVVYDDHSERHTGWFIGGGIEYALTKNWLLGVEYLHLGLEDRLHSSDSLGIERRIDGDIDIVRARLTFKFGRDDGLIPSLK